MKHKSYSLKPNRGLIVITKLGQGITKDSDVMTDDGRMKVYLDSGKRLITNKFRIIGYYD